MDIRDKELLW